MAGPNVDVPVSASDHLRRVLTSADAKDSLDWLSERVHAQVREAVKRFRAAGAEGSIYQPTAVLHSVYRVEAEREGRGSPPVPLWAARGPFRTRGRDVTDFAEGREDLEDNEALVLFGLIQINEARTYLANARRREDWPTGLDADLTARALSMGVPASNLLDCLERLGREEPKLAAIIQLVVLTELEWDQVGAMLNMSEDATRAAYEEACRMLRAFLPGGSADELG